MAQVKSWSMTGAALAAAALIVGSSYVATAAVAAAVGLVLLVLAAGWPYVLDVPAKKTLSAVILVAGVGAAAGAALEQAGPMMNWFPPAVALGVMAVFLVQLVRGTGQFLRLESTLGASAGVVLAASGSGWVAADRLAGNAANSGMMLVTGISLAVALLTGPLPWPDRFVAPLGILLAGLAGPLAALLFSDVPAAPAAVVGVVTGAVVVSVRRLVLFGGGTRALPAALAVGVTPVLAAGSLVYYLEKLLPA